MTIGGKYKWKPDNNPPPGLYDPKESFVRGSTKSMMMSPDKTKRIDFTKSPM